MATVDELYAQGVLEKIAGGLDDHELPERRLYAFPHVIHWIEQNIDAVEPLNGESGQSPLEQLDDVFYLFVSGADLSYWERSHSMFPDEHGMWEIKTPDLRIFGWFRRKGTFIITAIESAYRCKVYNLYPGFRTEGVWRRGEIDLDEPKFVTGDYDDVL